MVVDGMGWISECTFAMSTALQITMIMMTRYQSGPLDMMNLSEGRAPHEAITRVKQLEAVRITIIIIVTILLLVVMMMFRLRRDWGQV